MKKSPAKAELVGTKASDGGFDLPRRCAYWGMFLVVTVLLASVAMAQGSGLRVENVSPHTIEADPHQMITPTFRVRNETDEQIEVETEITLPDGWTLVTPVFPMILEARDEKFLFTTVSIPRDAQAGDYTITIEVGTTDFYAITDRAEVEIHLNAVAKLEVLPPMDELRTYSEEIYTRTFTVTNLSNASSGFTTEVSSNMDWEMIVDPPEFDLDAGESLEVIVSVDAGSIPRQMDHEVTLKVFSIDLNHGSVYARGKVVTYVYPRKLKGSLYHSLPGSATLLLAASDEGELASQLVIELNGDLGEGRWGNVRFAGPYPSEWRGQRFLYEDTFLIQYEEEGKGFYSVGDETLHITPLTERYYHYRGFDFERYHSGQSYRLFYAKQQQGLVPERMYGIQVTLLGDEESTQELILTGYSREELNIPFWQDRGKRYGETVTVLGRKELGEGIEVEAEYGISDYDKGDGRGRVDDSGYRLAVNIHDDGFNFDAEYVYGGDHFPGYWQGIDQSRLYLSYVLDPRLTVWGSYASKESDYFSGDDERSKSHVDIRDYGLNASFSGDTNLEIYQRWRRNKDTGLNLWYDINRSTNFRLTKQFENFSLTGTVSNDRHRDVLNEITDGVWKYELMFTASDGERNSISGGYRWNVEDTELGIRSFSNDHLWFNADVFINDSTEMRAGFSRTSGKDQSNITRIKANLEHDLGGEKTIELKSEWRTGSYGDEFDIVLQLTIPLNVPVPFFPKSGGLDGSLWEEGPSGEKRPLPGVIVIIGDESITTDDEGYFMFPELHDGQYSVKLDRGTLGLDRIPDLPQPIWVEIKAGTITTIDIPVVEPAAISGSIIREAEIPKTMAGGVVGQIEDVPLSGVVVILTNTGEERRTLTLRDGGFKFEDLRPGHWTVEVVKAYVPYGYELTPFFFELDLLPGEVVEGLKFYISRKAREIEITAGRLIEEEDEEEEPDEPFFVEEST